jgi:hypothetical protein
MSSTRRYLARARGALRTARHAGAIAVVVAALGATASAAAAEVNIVRQGEPPKIVPHGTQYFKTIQAAVNASKSGDFVLIEPGTYDEEVLVTSAHSGIDIRGINRNEVIIDGQHKAKPEGSNGIDVFKTNNVRIENLTVRNFDRASKSGPNGNEIWWNGGEESGQIGAHGWFGSYLTAYDTGLNGGYGIFTENEMNGGWEHIYASGMNDSGMYVGACWECQARIVDATMENNALGYSGSNAGGSLVIENSTIRHNTDGLVPNSENPADPPPPQDGICNAPRPTTPTPTFTSTEIARCTVFRNNLITENNNLTTPDNSSTAPAPEGVGVLLPGTYADLIEHNTISNNLNNGVLGFEFANPFPIQPSTIFFQFAGNRISNNTFSGNAPFGGEFTGDVTLEGGVNGQKESTNDCLSGNTFTSPTHPANIEGTWGCQNHTTPNPGGEAFGYVASSSFTSAMRTTEPQSAPPPQPTMPNPCEGVPKNPLCP